VAAWKTNQVAERHVSGDRLSAFLDDELGDDDALHAAWHVADCERCLGELAALRSTRDALRRLPSLQAPVLTAGVQARSQRLARAARRIKFVVAVWAVPVMLGAGIYVLGGDAGEVEPTTELFLVEHLGRTGGGPVPTAVGGDR
jgi:anti-sigma factor RsiW